SAGRGRIQYGTSRAGCKRNPASKRLAMRTTLALTVCLLAGTAHADALANLQPDKLEATHQAVLALRADWRLPDRPGPYRDHRLAAGVFRPGPAPRRLDVPLPPRRTHGLGRPRPDRHRDLQHARRLQGREELAGGPAQPAVAFAIGRSVPQVPAGGVLGVAR